VLHCLVPLYISYYKLEKLCLSVCVSVCLTVCLCVMTCIMGYLCVCTRNAEMCVFAYLLMEFLQSGWEQTTNHYTLHGLRTFHVHVLRTRKRAVRLTMIMCVHLLICGWILTKFGVNMLQVSTSCVGNVLFMCMQRMHARDACERVVQDRDAGRRT
jgi:hypothetical protein